MNDLLNTITVGDARELCSLIPDNSIDLIFTDPPYLKEYIPLYGWLSQEASRVLKPGGFLLTYIGTYYKADIMSLLGQHLSYYWDLVTMHPGDNSIIWHRKIIARYKSIMVYAKGDALPRTNVLSAWQGSAQDKRYHIWGQDEGTARYYIDCFSRPGEVIWEPFCGGGTTPYVCKILDRSFIAFEIDTATAEIARKRLETVQPLLMPREAEQLMWESEAAV